MGNKSPYDEFLFKKKIGFCEHFAGSFALLMRYANIPARVVVGYQGGEIFNEADNNKRSYVTHFIKIRSVEHTHIVAEFWLWNMLSS